jgi:eukaryotic-like serine/threonine-protein kinase
MAFLPDSTLDHLRQVAELPDFSGTRYRIEEELGRGGMGVVYRAWDAELERQVAIKVMESRAALGDEAKTLARLEHPGLVPVYDAGVLPDGRLWYAMRLIRGNRLDAFLGSETALPARLRILEKVCDAVAFAHERGMVHCDLKPQNVMVGEFGEVWVMDWGVARALGAAGPSAGTPRYMPPENSIDQRGDIFALGRLLEDLLPTGPPRPLAAIARRASAASPEDRYATAAEFAADLTRFMDHLPVTAYRETLVERLTRFYLRNQTLLLLLGAYLVVKVFFYFVRPR